MDMRSVGEVKEVVLRGSYCSFRKNVVREKVLCLDLYKGDRFELFKFKVEEMDRDKVFVFSGKYGIVLGSEYIEYYDKYFDKSEFYGMLVRVKKRFSELIERYGKIKVEYYIDDSIVKSWWYVEIIRRCGSELGFEVEIIDVLIDEVIDWEELMREKDRFVGF